MNLMTHPIHTGQFIINTQPAQDFVYAVQTWMAQGLLGGYAYGPPRIGKTEMSIHACSRLFTRSGELVPAFHLPQQSSTISTDRKFWGFVLTSLGIEYRSSEKGGTLFTSLFAFIRDAAQSNSENRVVIFLDEAQKLNRNEYNFLMDLMNKLKKCGVIPLFISIGPGELKDKVSALDPIKDDYFRGRFFWAEHRIFGLRGTEEIGHALRWYDRPHPNLNMQTPFTQDFLPNSYNAGFRLEDYAKPMWKVFRHLFGSEHRKIGWGMQYFQATVRLLLVDLLADEAELTGELIDIAIRNSGLFGPIENAHAKPPKGYLPA